VILGRIVVFGAGYVLGARAGRERFETIANAAAVLAGRLDAYSQASDGRRANETTAARTSG
jgi:hypothetical protein